MNILITYPGKGKFKQINNATRITQKLNGGGKVSELLISGEGFETMVPRGDAHESNVLRRAEAEKVLKMARGAKAKNAAKKALRDAESRVMRIEVFI